MWGMRVVFVSLLFYVFTVPVHAADIAVTATVPLTSSYKDLIQTHSKISVQRKNWALYISGRITDGTNPVKEESYDLLIVSDLDRIEVKQRDKSAVDGSFSYVFIPDRSRSYTLFLIDTAHQTPFLIGTLPL